ncbi:hypothetical protein [Mesorhizobium sp.]|uniref:hypothetical protein n=1 Tax=Mesorhizobium sp. TaxID=1871066 RepID=UPI0011F93FA6|nr:hypothetical protein [Mesorhizobium sp.]TIN83093.1 MAG: hypothetical protein E5X97_27560 [Mesorhizobium sp.]
MVDSAASIFRDFVTDGVPVSGKWAPLKSKIREWGTWLEGIVSGGIASTTVNTIADLQAVDTTAFTKATLKASGLYGDFVWTTGDFSSQIATDTLGGIYVKANAVAATVGAWVRQFDGPALDVWWGTAHNNVADDAPELQVAINTCQLVDRPLRLFPRGNYKLNTGLTVKHGQNSTDTKKYHFRLIGNDAQLLPDTGVTALSIVPRCTLADSGTGRGEAFIDIEDLTIYGSSSATAKGLVIGAAGMWCSNFGNNRLHNIIIQAFGSSGALSFIECRKWRGTSIVCRGSTLLIQAQTAGSIVGDLEFDFFEVTGSTVALPGMLINASVGSGLAQARGIVFNRGIFYNAGHKMTSGVGGQVADIYFNACQWDSGTAGAGNIAMSISTSGGGTMNGIHFDQPYIVNYTADAIKAQAANLGDITDINVIGGQIGTITCDNTGFNAAISFVKVKGGRIVGNGFTSIVGDNVGSAYIRLFQCSDVIVSENTGTNPTTMPRGVLVDGGNIQYWVCFNDLDAFTCVVDVDLAASGRVFGNRGEPLLRGSSSGIIFGGAVLSSGGGGVGYTTGAGGAVTQATSRTTGVTLNKTSGAITMFTAAGSATPASFTVTNSTVAATDTIILNIKSGASNTYFYFVTAVAAGSFVITFWTTGGTTSDTPVINFNVIKGIAA